MTHKRTKHLQQASILPVRKPGVDITFELNTNAVVVTSGPVAPLGFTGMPGPLIKTDKLFNLTLAVDHEVGGNPDPGQICKIRMFCHIQAAGK